MGAGLWACFVSTSPLEYLPGGSAAERLTDEAHNGKAPTRTSNPVQVAESGRMDEAS